MVTNPKLRRVTFPMSTAHRPSTLNEATLLSASCLCVKVRFACLAEVNTPFEVLKDTYVLWRSATPDQLRVSTTFCFNSEAAWVKFCVPLDHTRSSADDIWPYRLSFSKGYSLHFLKCLVTVQSNLYWFNVIKSGDRSVPQAHRVGKQLFHCSS